MDLPVIAYSTSLIYACMDCGLGLGAFLGHLNELKNMRAGSLLKWNDTSIAISSLRFLVVALFSYLWAVIVYYSQAIVGL